MKAVLCVLALGAVLAQGQTQPAARDLGAVSRDVLAAIQSVRNHTASLLKELGKQQPDRQTVQALAGEAVAQDGVGGSAAATQARLPSRPPETPPGAAS